MNIPCPINAPCLDDSNPFQNLSTEAPDVIHFFGYGSAPGSASPGKTTGPGGVGPRPGQQTLLECDAPNGPATCVATTQEEADLCVARLAQQCTQNPDEPPPVSPITPSGDPLFPNTLQQCTAFCPDGSPFVFQVAAGRFVAESQIVADREAQTYACRQAQILKVCFGSLSTTAACVGTSYSSTVTVSGGTGFSFLIVSGSLPPGITLSSSGSTILLSGTPTTAGNYSFQIRVVNSRGNFMVKSFTIFVLGFTSSSSLPGYAAGTPYTTTVTASGGTSPYTFTVTSGSLPSGLTLAAATGIISGTPGASGTLTPTITVTDSAGRTCAKQFSIAQSLKTGLQVCDWTNALSIMVGTGAFAGIPASPKPAWDGIFDLSIPDSFGNTVHYFISQSINGQTFAADEAPDYPTYPTWVDNDNFASLVFNGVNAWTLNILSTTGVSVWFGLLNGVSPEGDYTRLGGAAGSPNQISVRQTSNATCCPSAGDPVPAVFNPASPARVRIQNFAAFTAAIGACPGCQVSGAAAFDGTFPVKCTNGVANLHYGESGWVPDGVCSATSLVLFTPKSFAGFMIHNGIAGDFNLNASVSFVPSVRWAISINCIGTGPNKIMWQGSKFVGDTPQGVYIRDGSGGVAAGPACLTIESF